MARPFVASLNLLIKTVYADLSAAIFLLYSLYRIKHTGIIILKSVHGFINEGENLI